MSMPKTAAKVEHTQQSEVSKRHETSAAEGKAKHKGCKHAADVSKHTAEEEAKPAKLKASSGEQQHKPKSKCQKVSEATQGSSKHHKKSARHKQQLNMSSSTSTSGSHPASWNWQRFKSHEDVFLVLGPGSHRDKLYNCKKVLCKHVDKIVNLATQENYLTMETTESMHQEIFLQELKDIGTYLAELSEQILDITKQIELHRQSVVEWNLPPPPEPQEVFEIEREEETVTVKNEGDEEKAKVKVDKRKHRPKIEPRPVSDSSENNPVVQKYPKVQRPMIKEWENLCVNCAKIPFTLYKTCVIT